MKFDYLADHKEAIPIIARWYFGQWGELEADNSFGETVQKLHGYLNRDRIPLLILAIDNDQILGVAQLKYHEIPDYPDREHWLGGVYVPEKHRGKKIGQKLAGKIADIARSFEVQALYLQTQKLDGGLYKKIGWKPVEKIIYRRKEVLIMEKKL